MEKKQFRVPSEGLLDPETLRAKQVAKEEQERFELMADKIIELLIKYEFQFRELSRIWDTVIHKLGQKVEKSTLDRILKL